MPYRNKTGPLGRGPLTGRGFGFCTDDTIFGYGMQQRHRDGTGLTNRMGRGRGGNSRIINYRYFESNEKTFLEDEIKLLKNQLSELETRLKSFNKEEQ